MTVQNKYERSIELSVHRSSRGSGTAASEREKKLYDIAFTLSVFTIVYNIVEGGVATYFGHEDETFALFGFGLDSFIETMSGIGIAHMIHRIRRNNNMTHDDFERTALRVTGFAFYGLTIILLATAINNAVSRHRPQTTFWGVVISLISIVVMLALIHGKRKVGRELASEAILADANCTKVCIYMSFVLLAASGIYELTQFTYADAIGTAGLAYFSATEGRECFEKARTGAACACGHD
jgi:divalent metal cation (Fe/Co/Zn/Cd) transporter